jgi:Txe/YoeB family toxin of Txe-Axe toxin-antitoxin module
VKVVLTQESLERLEKVLRFYIEELEVPKAKVSEIKNRLIERTRSLSKNPYQGQYEPYLVKLKQGHRRLIEGNFKIVYRIEDDTVYVVDFFDSRENPSKMKG